MSGQWDTSLKRLVGEHPQQFARWLLPEASFQGKVKHKAVNLNPAEKERELDTLYELRLVKEEVFYAGKYSTQGLGLSRNSAGRP